MDMVISPLPASELVKMEGITNGELFSWNVRQYLTKNTKVNRDIKKSIRARSEHKYFPAFHDGLTILWNGLSRTNKELTISGYTVVNGCQSINGLYENRTALSPELCILTKFIHIQPDSTLARKITDHTNNQNGTTYRDDLQSNNPIQTRLQSEMIQRPSDFMSAPKGRHRLRFSIGKIAQMLVRLVNAEVTRTAVVDKETGISTPFDFKSNLKGQRAVIDLGSTIIAQYGIAIDSELAPPFEDLWKQSINANRRRN